MRKVEPETNKTGAPSADISRRRMRTGFIVFGVLLLIKVAEYLIFTGIRSGAWPYLLALAVLSAGLIAYYYKHIRQLWERGEDD